MKEHDGVQPNNNGDDDISISSGKDSSKYHKQIGTILPDSAHTIECKLCNREFHAQSRAAILAHLRKEHRNAVNKQNNEKRYDVIFKFMILNIIM